LSSINRPIELSTGYGKTAALYGLKMQRLQPFPGSVWPDYGSFMQRPEESTPNSSNEISTHFRHCEERSDEATKLSRKHWIASLRSQ
jgi:hypothetical protein